MIATLLCKAGAQPSANAGQKQLNLTFACAADNDLFTALTSSGYRCRRCATAGEAIAAAPVGSTVLILADASSQQVGSVGRDLLKARVDKDLRLYIEHGPSEPTRPPGEARGIEWERVVVATDRFAPALPLNRILMAPGCRFVPLSSGKLLLVLARVAGFDSAVYGLPDKTYPLLVERPDHLFEAAAPLSNFRRGRFAPAQDWVALWERLLSLLGPDAPEVHLNVLPAVRPTYAQTDRLPKDVERRALRRGAEWYRKSGLLLAPEHVAEIETALRAGKSSLPPAHNRTMGDGSHGILEGFSSTVRADGSQDHLIALRADCCAEAAMVFALDGDLNRRGDSSRIARSLLQYVYSKMQSGGRGDPRHPAFGLIAWGAVAPAWEVANYGDDNARTILASLVAASATNSAEWDKVLLRALLANLRTTGTLGFRGDRIDIPALEKNGWRHYHDAPTVNYSPHFEAYLWACYLWAYQRTRYAPFLERARTAIRMTMEAYPAGWRWKDSVERAHMLLPLAWLIRVEDTPEHREWLSRVAGDLLKTQQPSGAMREVFAGGGGHLHAPASNDAYGTGEAPLAQTDGDPVSDQLYTTGFALLGLHEAAASTGDARYQQAEARLAEYLCRIQVKSTDYPFVDGAWFRAFDYTKWDYWGSAADIGWGPWNAESGWGPAWINAMLALRRKKTTVWDFTATSRIAEQLSAVQQEMAINKGGPLR